MKVKLLFATCLLVVSGTALSQMTPQQQMQVPPSDPSSSQYNSVYLPAHGVGDTVQPGANNRWEDRWGALAEDGEGVLGVAVDAASKREARTMAVEDCKKRGGRQCEISLSYYNQCAVVVAGSSGSTKVRAATEQEATALAIKDCEAKDGAGACRVYYSGCSLPVRAQ